MLFSAFHHTQTSNHWIGLRFGHSKHYQKFTDVSYEIGADIKKINFSINNFF